MVSTRGPKSTFSENERVLCYEPDLTKAKVLYDSKVSKWRKTTSGRFQLLLLCLAFRSWRSTMVEISAVDASWST